MSPKFIFVDDVHEILAAGLEEIVVSEEARITPAARDLIKDRGLKVRYGSDQPNQTASPVPADTSDPVSESIDGKTEDEWTDDQIEAIVTRVIELVQSAKAEIKGSQSAVPSERSAGDDDLVICRCEEITRGEIKEAVKNGMSTLSGIKRVTRAGMGLCQGQTCQRLVAQILARELGVGPEDVEPTTARAPVRPVPLSVFATG